MKKIILLLLISVGAFAQRKVYNVQKYCVDQEPFKTGQCDITGNAYSFVFVDETAKSVVFFFTDMKMRYNIKSSNVSEIDPQWKVFMIEDEKGVAEMRVNSSKKKIEFHFPNNRIYLTVGESTKLE